MYLRQARVVGEHPLELALGVAGALEEAVGVAQVQVAGEVVGVVAHRALEDGQRLFGAAGLEQRGAELDARVDQVGPLGDRLAELVHGAEDVLLLLPD